MRHERGDAPAFKKERVVRPAEEGMGTFRIEVGHAHGVKPGNIVGAIANEAGIESKYIGRIEIYDDFSTLDLPADLPPDLLDHLKTVWVAGQQLNITRDGEAPAAKKSFGGPKKAGDRRFAEKQSFSKGPKKEHRKGPPKAE
jgi:ATP-dependent RNA helicase DeaD